MPAASPAEVSTSPSSTNSWFSSSSTCGIQRRELVGVGPVRGGRAAVEQARPRPARRRRCRSRRSGCRAGSWPAPPRTSVGSSPVRRGPRHPGAGHDHGVGRGQRRRRPRSGTMRVAGLGRAPGRRVRPARSPRTAVAPSSSRAAPSSWDGMAASKPTTGASSSTATRWQASRSAWQDSCTYWHSCHWSGRRGSARLLGEHHWTPAVSLDAPTSADRRPRRAGVHRAWIIAAVTFVTMLGAAGVPLGARAC